MRCLFYVVELPKASLVLMRKPHFSSSRLLSDISQYTSIHIKDVTIDEVRGI